ncbi:MAG: sulfite exporter TauE/SafE family protein [Bryobacteraceae bacterium]
MSFLWMAFALGLASSLHCAQMCGPIVLAFNVGSGGSPWRVNLAYNTGRILTYSVLGAVAGAATGQMGSLSGAGRWITMATGLLMMIFGLTMTARIRMAGVGLVQVGGWSASGWLTRQAGPLILSGGVGSKFRLGLVMGLLPCGMIWAALLQAAAAGGMVAGAVSMAAFGAGTAGALLGVGAFAAPVRSVVSRAGVSGTRIGGVLAMAAGAWIVWRASTFVAEVSCHGHGV